MHARLCLLTIMLLILRVLAPRKDVHGTVEFRAEWANFERFNQPACSWLYRVPVMCFIIMH